MTAIDRVPNSESISWHRPWWRVEVDQAIWREVADELAAGLWTLVSLWGDTASVHMAVLDEKSADLRVISLACPDRRFPSVGQRHPPAILLERAVRDLFGLEPVGVPDTRPWFDHGRWPVRHPLGPESECRPLDPNVPPYTFLPVIGEGVHQIPVGPIHAGIIEPGHFRFSVNGETVIRLEARLGFVHKGIEALMTGADLDTAARLAGRTSGDSTVAYTLAFCRAVEAAHDFVVPPRAIWLRALLAELERVANHLGDIGAICNDAAFPILQARFAILREEVLRASEACFGHRLMMDRVVPGGVATDVTADGRLLLTSLVNDLRRHSGRLVQLYDDTVSLKARMVSTGILRTELARQFGAGGYVGRASGRAADARRMPGYPPYTWMIFNVPVLRSGDVNARVWVRIKEVEHSLTLIETILLRLPAGPLRVPVPPIDSPSAVEGSSLVEGFRGDIFAWLRIEEDGRIGRCHLRDPSWFQWPLLEAAVEGNIVADFPLCNKSFNCSYSGHDS